MPRCANASHSKQPYAISSISSSTSSTISSTTAPSPFVLPSASASSSSSSVSGRPNSRLSAFNSSSSRSRHASHSFRTRRRSSTMAPFSLSSSILSCSSKSLLYSRRFLRMVFCSSLLRSVGGRGRQESCLNLSMCSSRRSSPLKS